MKRNDPTSTVPATTFAVASVSPAESLLPSISYADALAAALSIPDGFASLEAYSRDMKPLVELGQFPHAFVHAVNLAYDLHYPLILSPDMIWLLIAQGFAQHVNANAEALRDKLVAHSGQATLMVVRDEFLRGFAGNDWEGVFAEFSAQIRAHVGATTHDLLVPHFSTTGIVEQAAFEVTLMDSMQAYFNYRLMTRCGIPQITLEGSIDDWIAVRERAAALEPFDLNWWTDVLVPVLDEFIAASRGEADRSFWQEFYKLEDGSGGPYINGHIVNFFPYLVPKRPNDSAMEERYKKFSSAYRNPCLDKSSDKTYMFGIVSRVLPPALSCAPFTWDYMGSVYPMEFLAGFIGVAHDAETLALRPEIGWAVRERQEA